MTFDPLAAVGYIATITDETRRVVSGTCFLFRHEHVALTAAHCVHPGAGAVDLVFPRLGRVDRVHRIERHETADVALLLLQSDQAEQTGYPQAAFWDRVSNWSLGEDFFAYGFPDEHQDVAALSEPIPRLFKGNYQRFYEYSSSERYRYLAGEMSVPAPGGLSGGPIFRPDAPQMLTGLVTANHDSYAITDSQEELREGGTIYRLESRRLIAYGVALMLSGVSEWLRDVVPVREGIGWLS